MEPEAASSATPPAAPPARLSKREGRSPRDMALSLLVLVIPIALLLVFWRVVLDGERPVTVDPSSAFTQARQGTEFAVLEPAGLSEDWYVTTANFRRVEGGETLRIGYVAPDDDAALLVQSSVPPETLLPAELGAEAEPVDTFRASNGVWRQYRSQRGETALVQASDGRTVIVVGTASDEHLEALTGSLR